MMPEQKDHTLLSNFPKWKIILSAATIILHICFALGVSADKSLSRFSDADLAKIGQYTDAKCGPMSLLAASELLGVQANIDEIIKLSGSGEQGTTMYGLYQAAQAIGLSPRGMKLSILALQETGLPAILHVNSNHFVTLERFIGDDARIIDYGRVYFLSKSQLAKIWDGNALVLSRTNPKTDEKSPDIEFDELVYDFGEAYQEENIEHIFRFQNIGKKALVILNVEAPCRCTATLLAEKNIPPGSSGTIRMQFNTTQRKGAISETIKVRSNDPDEPVIYLTVVGIVNAIPAVVPTRIYLGDITNKDRIERNIKVIGPIEQGFKITAVETTSKYITTEVISSQQESQVVMRLKPGMPLGKIEEKIIIHTDNKKKPLIEIPIEGIVIGEITVSPERFFFGIVSKGKAELRKVIISKTGKSDLDIRSIKSDCSHFSVKVTPIQKGSKYSIEAILSENIPSGAVRGTVKVYTNYADQRVIDIPIYAFITDQ